MTKGERGKERKSSGARATTVEPTKKTRARARTRTRTKSKGTASDGCCAILRAYPPVLHFFLVKVPVGNTGNAALALATANLAQLETVECFHISGSSTKRDAMLCALQCRNSVSKIGENLAQLTLRPWCSNFRPEQTLRRGAPPTASPPPQR